MLVQQLPYSGDEVLSMELWNIEKEYLDAGLQYICGVDEAGAGPLCTPRR